MTEQRGQEPSPVTLPRTASYRIESEHVGRTMTVAVAEPVGGFRGLPPGPHRVLYVLDGDLFFGMATELTRLMHQLYGELPPLRVVGIGYDTDDPTLQAQLRARDFTFSADPGMAAMAGPGREPVLPEGERLGGGDAFLSFLTEELQPFLRDRCDVATDGATLFGSSLGGLFAAWALLRRAPGIDHYIIASPALWWNHGELLESEPSFRGAGSDRPRESRVFLGVGALEEDPGIPMLAEFRLVTNTRAFGAALEGHPDVAVTTTVFPDESHTSVVAPVLTRGLRTIYRRAGPVG